MLNNIIENTHNQPYFQIYVKFLQGGGLLTMHILEPMIISIKSIFFSNPVPLAFIAEPYRSEYDTLGRAATGQGPLILIIFEMVFASTREYLYSQTIIAHCAIMPSYQAG